MPSTATREARADGARISRPAEVACEGEDDTFRRIARGDVRALRAIWDALASRALALAMRLLPRAEAEAVTRATNMGDGFVVIARYVAL